MRTYIDIAGIVLYFAIVVKNGKSPRVAATTEGTAHRRLSAVDTPSVAEGRAQEELLEAAENALSWLYDRRAHLPEELLDPREAKHRKALRQAVRKASGRSPSDG